MLKSFRSLIFFFEIKYTIMYKVIHYIKYLRLNGYSTTTLNRWSTIKLVIKIRHVVLTYKKSQVPTFQRFTFISTPVDPDVSEYYIKFIYMLTGKNRECSTFLSVFFFKYLVAVEMFIYDLKIVANRVYRALELTLLES